MLIARTEYQRGREESNFRLVTVSAQELALERVIGLSLREERCRYLADLLSRGFIDERLHLSIEPSKLAVDQHHVDGQQECQNCYEDEEKKGREDADYPDSREEVSLIHGLIKARFSTSVDFTM